MKKILLILMLLCMVIPAFGASTNIPWLTPGGGDYWVGTNWVGGVPADGQDIAVWTGFSSVVTVTSTNDFSLGGIIWSNNTFDIRLDINDSTFTLTNSVGGTNFIFLGINNTADDFEIDSGTSGFINQTVDVLVNTIDSRFFHDNGGDLIWHGGSNYSFTVIGDVSPTNDLENYRLAASTKIQPTWTNFNVNSAVPYVSRAFDDTGNPSIQYSSQSNAAIIFNGINNCDTTHFTLNGDITWRKQQESRPLRIRNASTFSGTQIGTWTYWSSGSDNSGDPNSIEIPCLVPITLFSIETDKTSSGNLGYGYFENSASSVWNTVEYRITGPSIAHFTDAISPFNTNAIVTYNTTNIAQEIAMISFDVVGGSYTCKELWVDGRQKYKGTWGGTGSGAKFINDYMFENSNSVLTVLNGPAYKILRTGDKGIRTGDKWLCTGQ